MAQDRRSESTDNLGRYIGYGHAPAFRPSILTFGLGWRSARQRTNRNHKSSFSAIADDTDVNAIADHHTGHNIRQLLSILDWNPVERNDDVPTFDTGCVSRCFINDFGDQRASGSVKAEKVGNIRCDDLDRDTEPTSGNPAAAFELRYDRFYEVDWGSEPYADIAAGAAQDRGVYPDDFPSQIEQRTPRIPGIDRSIRLDEIVVWTGANHPPLAAHDARRHRLIEPEWIANSDQPVTDT